MPDFSQTMAEMIARARPQQAPPGRGAQVVHGGSSWMGSLGGKSTQIQAGIDAGAIAKLLGYKTPEEKEKINKQFMEMRSAYDDQTWEKVRKSEPAQKTLEGMFKAGYWPVYRDDEGLFNLPKMTPEYQARMDKPNAAMIGAGLYGEEPRAKLAQTEMLTQGTQQMNELRAAQAEMSRQHSALYQQQMQMAPEEFKLKQAESQQKLLTWQEQFMSAQASTRLHNAQAKAIEEGLDGKSLNELNELHKAYAGLNQKWMEKNALTPSNSDADGYRRIAELTPAVKSHIAGVKSISKGPSSIQAAEYSMSGWFSHVDKEFDRPTIKPKSNVWGVDIPWTSDAGPGEVAGSQANADLQKRYRNFYIREAVSMLRDSQSKNPEFLQTLAVWLAKAGIDHQSRTNIFNSLGLKPEEIAAIVQGAALRFK